MAKPDLLLPCECPDLSHVVNVSEFDEETGSVSVQFLMAPRSFAHRMKEVWKAFRGYGLLHDVVLSKEQAERLCEWLKRK